MKFMHVADLHLDTPFVGMGKEFSEIQKDLLAAPMTALERLVSVAINRQVDAFVIVGDVYNAHKQTISAQHFFQKQLQRLHQADIPVIFSHGNHDFLTHKMAGRKYPDNVHVFKEAQVDYVDLTLRTGEVARFYGFSYQTQWIQERKIQEFPQRNHGEADYVIGMLHGSSEAIDRESGNYAPFTIKEMRDKEYDYWALGHIHKSQKLHDVPTILYPGTIQGRHRNEDGPKGAYIVTLDKGQATQTEFIDVAPIQWEKVDIECQHMMQASDLTDRLESVMANYASQARAEDKSYILDVTLIHAERLDHDLSQQVQAGELIEALGIQRLEDYFVLISRIHLQRALNLQAFQYDPDLQDSFNTAVNQLTEDQEVYRKLMEHVSRHPIVREYLQEMFVDPEFKEAVVRAGQERVIQSLGFDVEVGEPDED